MRTIPFILGTLFATSAAAQHWLSAPLLLDATSATRAAADLDNDGDLDLIRVAPPPGSSGAVSVRTLLNSGTGEFSNGPAITLPAGVLNLLEIGDFDGDGDVDLAMPVSGFHPGGHGILTFRGASGGFLSGIHTPLEGPILGIASADVDGDGRADLAVLNEAIAVFPRRLRWLLGTASGVFQPQPGLSWSSGAGGLLGDLAIVDADGDGVPDIVAPTANPGTALAVFATGAGAALGPGALLSLPAVSAVPVLRAADFDGDGDRDLLTASFVNGEMRAVTFLNSGGGIWSTGIRQNLRVLSPGSPNSPGFTGFPFPLDGDGDGDADLMVLTGATYNGGPFFIDQMSGLVTRSPGVFELAWVQPDGISLQRGGAVADLDGDQVPDFAAAAEVYFGDGRLGPPYRNYVPGAIYDPRFIKADDWDGDGDIDVAWGGGSENGFGSPYSNPAFLLNNGGGEFSLRAFVYPTLPSPLQSWRQQATIIADIDGDVRPEIANYVLQLVPLMPLASGYVDHRRMRIGPDGVLSDAGPFSVPWNLVSFGWARPFPPMLDIDADGDLDLLYTGQVLVNDGSGLFSASTITYPGWSPGGTGDFDADGDADIIMTGPQGNLLAVFFNQGNGGLNGFVIDSTTDLFTGLRIADLDGDGDLDIAASTSSSSTLSLHLIENLGGTATQVHVIPVVSADSYYGGALDVGDIDGDGLLDLAVATGGFFPALHVFRRSGPGFLYGTPRRYRVFGFNSLRDADQDGDLDLFGFALVDGRRIRGPGPGFRRQYGTGTSGAGGWRPALGAVGPLRPGQTFALRVRDAVGSAAGILAIGLSESGLPNNPWPGLVSYASPWAAVLPITMSGAPLLAGAGGLDAPILVPPSVAGTSYFLQIGVVDGAAGPAIAVSHGLELRFGY